MTSPNTAKNTKKGIVYIWIRKRAPTPRPYKVEIKDTPAQRSKIAIGIENNAVNHESQGTIDRNRGPPANIKYKNY